MINAAAHFTSRRRRFRQPEDINSVATHQIPAYVEDWIAFSIIEQGSERTAELRRMLAGRLTWWLERNDCAECGPRELQRFFTHLTTGHSKPDGRWGLGAAHGGKQPLRPITIRGYYVHLGSLFKHLVRQEIIDESPMDELPKPKVAQEQPEPFTEDQVHAMIAAARQMRYGARNEALLRFLVDTGARAAEVCGMLTRDVDVLALKAEVLGKGNKRRLVYFGPRTAKAMRVYLRLDEHLPDDPFFIAAGGSALTRAGLRQLIEHVGKAAGIQITRCSPHTFRHTFATMSLRHGANAFSVQNQLGHSTLAMTRKYSRLNDADLAKQHRLFSPGDRIK